MSHRSRHPGWNERAPFAVLLVASDEGPTSGGVLQEMVLFSPAPSIYGGSDQVQRNIIGERALGLPKEPGPDREIPFRNLPPNS